MAEEKKKLYRSKSDRIIAGVCGGLGRYLEIDPIFFRLAFVLLTFFGGLGILIYLIMFLIVPEEGELAEPISSEDYRSRRKAEVVEIVHRNHNRRRLWAGIILILLGVVFFLEKYFPNIFNFDNFWPLLLILLGVIVLVKK